MSQYPPPPAYTAGPSGPPPAYTARDPNKTSSGGDSVRRRRKPSSSTTTTTADAGTIPIYVETTTIYADGLDAFLGREPARVICPNCQTMVTTRVYGEPGPFAWLMSALTCIVW